MKQVLICQHGGSSNHGCEALARTVIGLLHEACADISITLYSYSCGSDRKYLRDISDQVAITGLASLPGKYSWTNIRYHFKQISGSASASKLPLTKEFTSLVDSADLVIAIGGDNYCYNKGRGYYALDRYIKSRGKRYVLIGCSIEPDEIPGDLGRHLRLFDLITAREKITYEALLANGLYQTVYVPDSAFLLSAELDDLPEGFVPEQAVGINLSPLILKSEQVPGVTLDNFRGLVKYILDSTDLQIALIPHVVWAEGDDRDILAKLAQPYLDSGRVFIISDNNACRLKGVISRLRFFIGARTHATIAAYSSGVPTLVVGYSVKAKGIAQDLFGTYQGYVLPVQELRSEKDLTTVFSGIMEHEQEIKERLLFFLPTYRGKARNLVYYLRKMLNDADLAPMAKANYPARLTAYNQCVGCGLCAAGCRSGCISLQADNEGFLRPVINESDCVHCGLCASICPVNHERKEGLNRVYAAKSCFDDQRKSSSSGAIFPLLAAQTLAAGGAVCGAAYDDNLALRHVIVEDAAALSLLMGSKYLQSDIHDLYDRIGALLNDGRKVLFCGTPCQTAAIYDRFSQEQGLLTMALACHGAPSPDVFRQYLDELAKEYGAKVASISFRDKTQGNNHTTRLDLSDGRVVYLDNRTDPYFRLFIGDVSTRLSCGSCFAKGKVTADLLCGDYWGVEKLHPRLADGLGCSVVVALTEKGDSAFQEIKKSLVWENSDLERAGRYNPCLLHPANVHDKRKYFFSQRTKKSLKQLATELFPEPQGRDKAILQAKRFIRKVIR